MILVCLSLCMCLVDQPNERDLLDLLALSSSCVDLIVRCLRLRRSGAIFCPGIKAKDVDFSGFSRKVQNSACLQLFVHYSLFSAILL